MNFSFQSLINKIARKKGSTHMTNCMIITFSCIWIIYPWHYLIFKLHFSQLGYWCNLDLIKKCRKSNELKKILWVIYNPATEKGHMCNVIAFNTSFSIPFETRTTKISKSREQGILQKILFEKRHIYILQLNLYKESPQTYFIRNSLFIFPTNFHA